MIEMRRLAVLHEVAVAGTFSAAARVLGYSQSAVSQQIATLEREVGMRLVERHPRRVRLTDAGRVLVRCGRAVLAELALAEDELRMISEGRAGRIRIATFATALSSPLLPTAIRRLRTEHAGLEVSVSLTELPAEALRQLQLGHVDLAVLVGPPAGDDRCRMQHLIDDPLLVALPAGHPLAMQGGVALAALADEDWIVNGTADCPDADLVRRACGAAGFAPRVALQVALDDYQATLGMVAAGLGVALIPQLALTPPRPDVVALPLLGAPVGRSIVAATRSATGPLAADVLPRMIRAAYADVVGSRSGPARD